MQRNEVRANKKGAFYKEQKEFHAPDGEKIRSGI